MYIVVKNGIEGQKYLTIQEAAKAIADAKKQDVNSEFSIKVSS